MFISLLEYLFNQKIIYIYAQDGSHWPGQVTAVWFDCVVIRTEKSPKIIIPFARIEDIREYDVHGARNILEKSLEKEN